MDSVQKLTTSPPSLSPSSSGSTHFGGEGRALGVGVAVSGPDHPPLLLYWNPRGVVSLWTCSNLCAISLVVGIFWGYTLRRRVVVVSLQTCSKLCAISLVAGIFWGYTLKRQVQGWVIKLLKRLKND